LGCEPSLRLEGQGSQTGDPERPYVTDGGHYTADCLFPSIPDPAALEEEIKRIPGALETGLFIGLTKSAVIARQDGTEVIQASTL
jgi:ribose 5-phosphate isomerase A